MPKPPKKTPDRHYDFGSLNQIFAWSSVALLGVTLWMVFDDYAKPWKRMQAEFRSLERQKLRAELEEERRQLDQEELAGVREQIEAERAALADRRDRLSELQSEVTRLDKKIYAADARARTTKSILDTARYELDVAIQKGGEEGEAEARHRFEELSARYFENRTELEALQEARAEAQREIALVREGLVAAQGRLDGQLAALDSLEVRMANLSKKLDYFVLNAPLMDFIEPDLKIEQIILPGLYQDINFTTVERVDRCMTCHVAANRAGFDGEEWREPFRTHPRPDLFLSAGSPHPYSTFGCTTCHGGLDRATDFARAGHSPVDEEQLARWKESYGWEAQKYLEMPIRPAGMSEAGCVGCHAGNLWTPESEVQDVGREIMSRAGCYACHKIDYSAFTDLPRPGPALRRVASKTSPGWAYRWIEAPREFRPTSWMPHFFFQENIEGEVNEERQRIEIAAAVAYIWDRSERVEYPAPPPGDAARGRAHFETLGCTGCHLIDGEAQRDQFYPAFNRMHGPNLVRTGSKVEAGWLFAWLKDPQKYNPDSRMPSLRLTDGEAADLVAYLMSLRDPEFEGLDVPEVDAELRDEMVRHYLQATQTIEQSQATVAAMTPRERDVYLGGETIRKYGCFGCHELDGFDDAKPIGVELTEEGSKPLHQFDFGHVHDVPHTRHDWIQTKLLRPRIWDEGKERVKDYHELYKMPDFGFSEREARAVTVNVLGFLEESVVAELRADAGPDAAVLAEGRKLITRYNCRGCHLVEGQGHAIQTALESVDMLPPNLASEGSRVRSEWLFDYLHDPGAVRLRPWLGARMPTFAFSDEEVNVLLDYFAERDGREAFLSAAERPDERSRAVGEVVFGMLQCAKCHPAGPAAAAGGVVSAGELAPSLLLARERLRHDWVPGWIKDPQSFIPGTKMPANFVQKRDGTWESPIAAAIDAPMFSAQKRSMLRHFESDEGLKEFLADPDRVTVALRDHIWWNLR
ncbi:MAG: c-type cytochrome [Thermoanaerobaculia bacterium]|nr:c-type cytochrome [Thermoanaerobaculia bacterium]